MEDTDKMRESMDGKSNEVENGSQKKEIHDKTNEMMQMNHENIKNSIHDEGKQQGQIKQENFDLKDEIKEDTNNQVFKRKSETQMKGMSSSKRLKMKSESISSDTNPTDTTSLKQSRSRPAKSSTETKSNTEGTAKSQTKSSFKIADDPEAMIEEIVGTLPNEITSRFGSIVWARMTGYPYWPGLIVDPRVSTAPKMHKDLDKKFLIFFYHNNNFAQILMKNVEPWDDTKQDYRQGFPVKEAKAPKRRAALMDAIEIADKELNLPIEERAEGRFKEIEEDESETEEEEEILSKKAMKKKVKSTKKPEKSSKNKSKSTTNTTSSKKAKAQDKPTKRKRKDQADEETTSSVGDDDEGSENTSPIAAPSRSKEEIKAKVANRKVPSKKAKSSHSTHSTSGGPTGSSTTKDDVHGNRKSSKSTSSKEKSSAKAELDSKRKKEIELVVPRKSVKSSDIRKLTDRDNSGNDKGSSKMEIVKKEPITYVVGDLNVFTTTLKTLEAEGKVDDLLIQLNTLFQEKKIYRSDVESSGLAKLIATLRKDSNPTVAQTVSAIRKHLKTILLVDAPALVVEASEDKTSKPKKAVPTPPKQTPKSSERPKKESEQKLTPSEEKNPNLPEKIQLEAKPVKSDDGPEASSTSIKVPVSPAKTPASPIKKISSPAKKPNAPPKSKKSPENTPISPQETTTSAPIALKTTPVNTLSVEEDKNRQSFIAMLSDVLKINSNAEDVVKIAREIEENTYDRFKESNEEYRSRARLITFGLKNNEALRQRVINGTLHVLELVFETDEFFQQ